MGLTYLNCVIFFVHLLNLAPSTVAPIMKLSLALPPLLLLLRDAHGAHPRLAVASAPRSEQLRLIPRPERLTELLRVPERLRGGGEEAEEAKPAHEVQSRKRLTVAETEAADPSSLMLSADALESLGLAGGEPVLLRGGKQRKTVCVAVGSEKGLSEDDVKLSAAARANLRLSAGDAVVATPMRDLPEAERVELCLISESAAGFEGGFEERFGGLTSYFKDMGRPVTEGDVIETEVDGHTLRWKVCGWRSPPPPPLDALPLPAPAPPDPRPAFAAAGDGGGGARG